MTNELVIPGNIGSLGTDELRNLLTKGIEITVSNLKKLAVIWTELEKRGEDLSSLKKGLMAYLPLIASDRVDATLVVKYAGQKMLLSHLASVSPVTQKRLMEDDRIIVIEKREESFTQKAKELSSLTSREILQVFKADQLRSAEEQITLLKIQEKREITVYKRHYRQITRISVKRNNLIIGEDIAVSLNLVLDKLSSHYGVDFNRLLEEQHPSANQPTTK